MSFSKKISLVMFLFGIPTILWAQEAKIRVQIKGLSCPFCVYGVEKKLKAIPGVQSVTTHYKQGVSIVEKEDKAVIDMTALTQAVTDAGFTVDFITLTVKGSLTEWKGHPALKDASSGEVFLLVDQGKDHADEFLSTSKLETLKALGGKTLIIKGKAHSHVGTPTALEVDDVRSGS